MSWASLIVAGLKLILSLVNWAKAKELMNAGEDAAVARASLAVLEATAEGQRLRDMLAMYNDAEAEELWKRMLDAK